MLPVPASIDRALARPVERIEIISPRAADPRDENVRASRRRDDWAMAWRHAQHEERAAAYHAYGARFASPRYAAQRLAQEGFGQGAHLENWRGAARAYADAQSLAVHGDDEAVGISILV